MHYLEQLNVRLAEGLQRLPEARRRRHADFLAGKQNPDGGFPGREGDSDLYYTAFALRGLTVLNALTPEVAQRAAGFLRGCLQHQTSVVDFFSFLFGCLLVQTGGGPDVLAGSSSDWPLRVAQTLETFRTPDHGYNKSTGATGGSTYHTFLVGLCYQLLHQPWPRTEELLAFVRSRKREDGGFVEVAPMRRSGTNPTAAGVGILQLLLNHQVPAEETQPIIGYLAQMPSMEGGLRANDRIPLADLLSTFTGSWTLDRLGALDQVSAKQLRAYVEALEQPEGGFHAGLWDEVCDVEYSFYGLGTLALVG